MKRYISIIAAVVLAAGISGCKKGYLDLEANPNNPSQTTPQLILAGALTTVPNITVGDYVGSYDVWAGYWSWNGGVVPPASLFEYTFTNSTYEGIWSDLYANATNFNNLIAASAKDPSLAHFQAIGMIMKAWDFEQLVDNYNDVPYSQAFQPSTILFPKYDKAADIYVDLGKQLDAAVALAGQGGTSPGVSDVMFGGNMSLWIQTANTLKLRLAIRLSNLNKGTTAPSLGAALPSTSGAYLSTDALINPGYANNVNQENPYYGNFVKDPNGNTAGNGNVYRANAFSIKLLQTMNDTLRLAMMFSTAFQPPATQGGADTSTVVVYRGNVYGDAVNIRGTRNTSGAGPAYSKSPSQSSIFILASESYFLQAEAAARSWVGTPADAAGFYNLGIEADFAYLGLTKAQADVYIAANPYPAGQDRDTKEVPAIILQKYIMFLNGYDSFEAYNDYRRTGYPALPSSVDPAALSDHLPTRMYYPLSELTTNPDNYKAAGGLTIDPFTSKIFWAK